LAAAAVLEPAASVHQKIRAAGGGQSLREDRTVKTEIDTYQQCEAENTDIQGNRDPYRDELQATIERMGEQVEAQRQKLAKLHADVDAGGRRFPRADAG